MSDQLRQTEIEGREINGLQVTPSLDLYVNLDTWLHGELLEEWEPEGGPGVLGMRSQALSNLRGEHTCLPIERIRVTGRTIQWASFPSDLRKVRVKVVFAGDEPVEERTVRGWMFLA